MDGIVVKSGGQVVRNVSEEVYDLPTTIFYFISAKFAAYVLNAEWAKIDRKSFDT